MSCKTAQQIESFGFRVEVNLLERRLGVSRLDLNEKAVQIVGIVDLRSLQRSARILTRSIRKLTRSGR